MRCARDGRRTGWGRMSEVWSRPVQLRRWGALSDDYQRLTVLPVLSRLGSHDGPRHREERNQACFTGRSHREFKSSPSSVAGLYKNRPKRSPPRRAAVPRARHGRIDCAGFAGPDHLSWTGSWSGP